MRALVLIILMMIALVVGSLQGQSRKKGPIGDWTFHPNYTLERNAENYPGPKIMAPKTRFQQFKTQGAPIYFFEQEPTERLVDFMESDRLPSGNFTVELWLVNHVNLPVGAMMTARSKMIDEEPAWYIGTYGHEITFAVQTQNGMKAITQKIGRGWKKYWGHLVGVYQGTKMTLYFNGEEVGALDLVNGQRIIPKTEHLELAAYLKQEPYMQLSNLLKAARLYDRVLSKDEMTERFEELQARVEQGALFDEIFHFNAGPYLHLPTQNSMNILWETDRLATAVVKYGTSLPLKEKVELSEAAYIQEVTLKDLESATPYYYEVVATATDGSQMSSGVLTFGTAVEQKGAFTFCIIGDTESRPHINHRLGNLIWEERPNFILHLGDVTDGGFEDHKFEWNYEYFTGITPIASRIPMLPVPGNGESDLYWYNRYHRLPDPEAYYHARYGDAEFFMLNSNANDELKKGGVQYEWLKEKLAQSTAKWKFVAHHHCPVSSDENDFGDTWKGKPSIQGDPKFDDLKLLYESAGVDVVFYGHVHAYERSWPLKEGQIDQENGVVYVQSGGGGGHLEDFTPTRNSFTNKVQRGNHYCKVDIAGNEFYFRMFDTEGRLKDFFEIKK